MLDILFKVNTQLTFSCQNFVAMHSLKMTLTVTKLQKLSQFGVKVLASSQDSTVGSDFCFIFILLFNFIAALHWHLIVEPWYHSFLMLYSITV